MFFFKPEEEVEARKEIEKLIAESKFSLIGWREVPVDQSCLGQLALENAPMIYQMVLDGGKMTEDEIEIQTYGLRR